MIVRKIIKTTLRTTFLAIAVLGLGSEIAQAKNIVASIGPIQSLVAGVLGEQGKIELLVSNDQSFHDFQLTPSAARMLYTADLFFYVNAELEFFLERILPEIKAAKVQLSVPEWGLLVKRKANDWKDEYDHDDDHDNEHGHDHGHKHHGSTDYHLWLDPQKAILMVGAIRDALTKLMPEDKEIFQNNAQQYIQRLEELDLQLAQKLTPYKNVPFITFHQAYQYFEARYGLNGIGSVTIDPEHGASVKQLFNVRRHVDDVVCVFEEPQYSASATAKTAIEGKDVRVGILDPQGYDLVAGPDMYFQLLNNLTQNLVDCLDG